MPSFADSIFLFVLALLLFGPKRLPVLARELGKWVGEFRRASNEFKMQMEDELRASEQADRQKQITAMEAAAPIPPPLPEAEPSIMPPVQTTSDESTNQAAATAERSPDPELGEGEGSLLAVANATDGHAPTAIAESVDGVRPVPLPIAVSGDLRMMPPATGLPQPRAYSSHGNGSGDALGGLLDAIPETPENAHHGD